MKIFRMLVIGLLALAIPVLADPPMTTLRVEVTTQKDRPVDRASVVIDFVEGRSIAKFGKKIRTHWETRTNQDGVAKLPPMPQGKVRIQVIAKGYQTFGELYDVNEEEKTITIKLNPPQSQYSVHQ
jgi:hypothetical protein